MKMKHICHILPILLALVAGCAHNELFRTETGEMKPLSAWTLEDVVGTNYVVTVEGDNMVITGRTNDTIRLDISGGFPIVTVSGTVIYRDSCGQVLQLAQYREGQLHGIVLEWNGGCACTPAPARLYQKSTYRNGQPVGVRTWWYRSGRPWGVARYDSSGESSINTVWYENGNRMYHGRFIREHTPDGVHTNWYENGSLENIQYWKAGSVIKELTPEEITREQSPASDSETRADGAAFGTPEE